MAHADYECCAVCDGRMSYSSNAEGKQLVCPRCALEIMKLSGQEVTTSEEFIAWVNDYQKRHVLPMLRKLGFRKCYYGNDVDEAVAKKLGKAFQFDEERHLK